MGRSKSPGKWIKTLLFGKKTRSSLSKGREILKAANEKDVRAAKAPTANLDVDPLLNSRPEHDTIDSNGEKSVGAASNILCEGVVLLQGNHDANKLETTVSGVANDAERIRQEQAATKAQAAFRGYLARRAFRALKGIIRLQALVRGHLVRRQAIATIHCMHGIVKLQALVRGRRVRLSDSGLEVQKNCSSGKLLDAKYLESFKVNVSTWTEKLPTNAFVSKLLASSPIAMPLRLQYGPGEPNSAWNWLERWTSFHFWQPLPQPKKIVDSKSQTRQGNLRTESGRPKRSVRRLSTANVDNGSIPLISESEKPKRNPKKVLSHPIDTVHEHPQNELEKVKRNMRKISSSTIEASDQGEVETEKPKRSLRKTTSSAAPDISDPSTSDWAEKTKTDTTVAVPKKPEIAVAKQPQTTPEDGPVDALQSNHHPAVELLPSESGGKDENIPPTNGELSPKEDQTSNGNLKTSRRRASFPAKQEEPENGVQNNPTLPSYMAATASAKAKLRGQGSPRFGQDEAEKNGFTRRHSLPSSTNGKLSSLSLRTQVLVQASGKGGIRSDKSLLTSKDGKEKVIQADWKR